MVGTQQQLSGSVGMLGMKWQGEACRFHETMGMKRKVEPTHEDRREVIDPSPSPGEPSECGAEV